MRLERTKHHGARVEDIALSALEKGDLIVFRTAHNTYRFWIEFPAKGIGVLVGGQTGWPTRVKLAAEQPSDSTGGLGHLRPGDRARVTYLGPSGEPLRCVLTSTISSIRLMPRHHAAA